MYVVYLDSEVWLSTPHSSLGLQGVSLRPVRVLDEETLFIAEPISPDWTACPPPPVSASRIGQNRIAPPPRPVVTG